jgi:hypothetical protein
MTVKELKKTRKQRRRGQADYAKQQVDEENLATFE